MPHGLSDEFLAALNRGELRWLTDRVRQDQTLDLEIRDDQIQVYYRGGRLMLVQRRGQAYPSAFDTSYVAAGRILPCAVPTDARMSEVWLAAIPLLKQEMDFYFATVRSMPEREFQQQLVRQNNQCEIANSTDYFICSMEYQSPMGRFDSVAVHWPSNGPCRKQRDRLPLALVEIKYGDQAIAGECGLLEHLRDFATLARDPQRIEQLCAEMTCVFQQKHQLGLIPGTSHAVESISAERLQVLFVLANTDPSASLLARALDEVNEEFSPLFPGGIWISRASQFGAGLFQDQNLSVAEFRAQLSEQRTRAESWNGRFRNRS